MGDRHPREMTLRELESLPTVNRLFRIDMSFIAANGQQWDVGAAGSIWVKAWNGGEPAAAEASRGAARA